MTVSMGKLEASMENPVVGRDATMVKRKTSASAIDDGHSIFTSRAGPRGQTLGDCGGSV